MEEVVRRAFEILKRQDERITAYAKEIPNMNKSLIVRIALELGLADLATSDVMARLRGGSIALVRDSLQERQAKRKSKASAGRRS